MFVEYDDCFIWKCEQCGKEAQFAPNDFWSCVAELKSRGWGFERDEGEWHHSCGYCNHKRRQTNIMERTIKTVK
jgi:hypothetical protein